MGSRGCSGGFAWRGCRRFRAVYVGYVSVECHWALAVGLGGFEIYSSRATFLSGVPDGLDQGSASILWLNMACRTNYHLGYRVAGRFCDDLG